MQDIRLKITDFLREITDISFIIHQSKILRVPLSIGRSTRAKEGRTRKDNDEGEERRREKEAGRRRKQKEGERERRMQRDGEGVKSKKEGEIGRMSLEERMKQNKKEKHFFFKPIYLQFYLVAAVRTFLNCRGSIRSKDDLNIYLIN